MKKTVCWTVLVSLLASPVTAGPVLESGLRLATQAGSTCAAAERQGRDGAGEQHGTVGWLIGGVAAGVVGGLIGTGVVVAAAGLSGAQPKADTIPTDVDAQCYRRGYKGKAKSKNLVSSLLGGGLGTAIWLLVFYANADE